MVVPTLGEIVREFRAARNMSRPVFAQRAKVHPSTVYNIEKGLTDNLRTEQFERVASVMGTDAEALRQRIIGASPLVLSEELTAKIREFSAREERDPLEWLTWAVNDAEPPKPGEKRVKAPNVAKVPRRGEHRHPPTADKPGHAAANS